jgi:hypothetical protein
MNHKTIASPTAPESSTKKTSTSEEEAIEVGANEVV